ncbi:putative bifunctional diguanylate cyclase/phosphodiesterase [Saccharospirillum salsuginis]|uniref:Diguanylate cyclase (GGDEF) domain-containing protein n=1 Tax=Saccharospirillum salsuginis TaxID=418750 RepID=A0A918KJL4_9GAMM|nr:EAL domain-containing protein [Saccharospirillum salsuginis]GGX65890.1 hypothetical protein GCM10007392_36880 [Saccharospirillum salsuginis]
MTVNRLPTRGPPGITVMLENEANAKLLSRMMEGSFELSPSLPDPDDDVYPARLPELILIDVASLRREKERILRLRQLAGVMALPVLLVTDRRSTPRTEATRELGESVDDILNVPTTRLELKTRIDNLRRLRELSLEQIENQRQLKGVVSSLRTLNACDRVIVRSTSEQELLRSLCRTIVEEDGFSLAWIGFATHAEHKSVAIHACAGPAAAFVPEMTLGLGNDPNYESLALKAIMTGRPHSLRDIARDLGPSYIRDRALFHRLASVIALPLITETEPHGCLTIYSDKPNRFGYEERQLFERLADNLTYGVNNLRVKREREAQASEIHYLAYTDALTGLPNRRHLIHYLNNLLARNDTQATECAVLFIDLDGFKLINDALGHDVGDRVLRQIGRRLQNAVRDQDLVVRQGGDEFLVVMNDDPRSGESNSTEQIAANARDLAKRIIDHLSEPLVAGNYPYRLKASVGISLCPDHGKTGLALIENADKAMYEAKRRGGGQGCLFTPDLATSRHRRLSLESQLRQALADDEFELHYQPIFELSTCRIVAAEALIRWRQPDGDLVMPGSFMPLAEEIGLIKPIGDWVLDTAARQLRTWHDAGYSLAMAVNVSVNQLYPDADAEHFAALVRPHVDPLWVHLEVTENALMHDPIAIEALLTDLNAKGFQLAIDDFGTGYSSLNRLQHLSIQSLKIDRSFISELGTDNHKGASLVPIIQQMASQLNLLTIAEGIETDEQRRLLLKTATPAAWGQGFWFSKGVPPAEMEELLRKEPVE